MSDPGPSSSLSSLLTSLFQALPGTWLLNRKLQSANPSEPAGRCTGKATFTRTQSPSLVVGADGLLDLAEAELLYHEQGEFEMSAPSTTPGLRMNSHVSTFSFSRKYIWRLHHAENACTISIWFTKPGTDAIDYLFHKIDIPYNQQDGSQPDGHIVLRGTGGHLCIEDFYNSSYTFTMSRRRGNPFLDLSSWTTLHEVVGPKKDQVIETTFTRS